MAAHDAPRAERVQKVLARAGYGSRRACEVLIAEGRVTVDGRPATLGDRVDPGVAALAVDGVPVPTAPGLVHYLLNKPAGVVTTASDPQGRRTVTDLVPPEPRVFPVGRLDYETEGLLLLTNDGELAQRLTHPRFGVEKTYLAEVVGVPTPAAVRRLREGVTLDDGPTAPARVVLVQAGTGPHTTDRARGHDPRGAEPSGPADVRRGRPSGPPAGAHPDRPGPRDPARARCVAGADGGRGPGALRGRRCPGTGGDPAVTSSP